MARILAFDYGVKRTGLACTDELQIIASPLETIDSKLVIQWVKDYVYKEKVQAFVLGDPSMFGSEITDSSQPIAKFKESLKKHFPSYPIHMVDESFTSSEAVSAMIQGGMKKSKRRQKGQIDQIAATLILQRYLESIS